MNIQLGASCLNPHSHSPLICVLLSAVAVLSIVGIYIFFYVKKRKYEEAEVSSIPQTMEDYEKSVLMVELRG